MALSRVDINYAISRLPRHRKGEVLTSSKLNNAIKSVNRVLPSIKPPIQVSRINSAKPNTVQQFKIDSVDEDYIIGKFFDGTDNPEAELVYIAKPYLLRKTPFHGLTRTVGGVVIKYTQSSNDQRVAQAGAKYEIQVVVPAYSNDDIIYAILGVVGGVNVQYKPNDPSTPDPTQPNTNPVIEWLDLNVDGRAWAKKKA